MDTNINFKIRTNDHKMTELSKEEDIDWKEPFVFIQSADTQFGMIDDLAKVANPNWDKEFRLTADAIKAANQMKPRPKFFVVCGDLVDALPGNPNKGPQIRDFKKCFDRLENDIPLVCVCGNHDVGDSPTQESINEYRKEFGDDFFTFNCSGVLFIVLNSQYFKDKSQVEELAEQQIQWLDKVLEENNTKRFKHIIVFQHIPWFLSLPEENDQYFNIEKEFRIEMLDKLYSAGVRTVFTGHYHRNAGGMYKDMELVVTSAIGAQLGDDKSGLRVVKVYEKSVQHKYYNIEEIPENIDL